MGTSGRVGDTIVAQATPPGPGAVAVVRLSGPDAVAIVSRLTCADPSTWEPRRTVLRLLRDPASEEVLDRALVVVYPAPASYTGEDVVELSTHGGYLIPARVVDACVTVGARLARPGEFTQRAFLHGKLDLTQAEAVGDLVAARAPKAATVALHQLERGLGERVALLRESLVGLGAHLIQHIDFPEEDDAPVPLDAVAGKAREVAAALSRLVGTAPSGELLREGALTVLAGPPNSGKSSLFNALVGQERAIVTEVAGTTRDALEAVVSVGGFPFRLVDTAGLRREPGRIERLGIEVAERYLARADLVLYCTEAIGTVSREEQDFLAGLQGPVIRVRTKADLLEGAVESDPAGGAGSALATVAGADEAGANMGAGPVPPSALLSARSGSGLDDLRRVMMELVFGGVVDNRSDVPVVTSARQARLLEVAGDEVAAFARALDGGVPPEVARAHLKEAESALEEILGLITTDEVLDRVFREFCIGK